MAGDDPAIERARERESMHAAEVIIREVQRRLHKMDAPTRAWLLRRLAEKELAD